MAIKIGNTTPNKFYVGNTQVQKMYMGTQLIYSATPALPSAPARTIEYDFVRGNAAGDDQRVIDLAGTNHLILGDASTSESSDPQWTYQGIYTPGATHLRRTRTPFLNQEFTIMMFMNPSTAHDAMVFSIADSVNLKIDQALNTKLEYKRSTDGNYGTPYGPTYVANSRFIYSVRKTSANFRIGVNKTYTTVAETAGIQYNGTDAFFFRHVNDTYARYANGAMNYFLYFNRALSDSEFDQAYDYMTAAVQQKHGISLGSGAPSTSTSPPLVPIVNAVSAKSFQEAATVAGHIERYTDTEWATLKNKIADGNFAVFRAAWSSTREITRAQQLGALGVKLIVAVDPVGGVVPRQYNTDGSAGSDPYWYSTGSGQFRYVDQLIDAIGPQYVAIVAGINEPNVFILPKRRTSQASNYVYGGGGSWDVSPSGAKFAEYVQTVKDIQIDTWRTVRSRSDFNHIKVIGASWTSVDYFTQQGDIGSYIDAGNAHAYFGGRPVETGPWGSAGYASVDDYFIPKMVNVAKPGGPYASDEGGIASSEVYRSDTQVTNESLRGKMLMRHFMDLHRKGLRYAITTYELHDNTANLPADREATFGLLYNNMTDKVSYTYLKNLFGILKDPGVDFTTSGLKFGLSGTLTDIRSHLLQKRDGSYWIALWIGKAGQDPDTHVPATVASQSVTVTFETAKNVALYDPTISQAVQSSSSAVTSTTVSVTEGIKLIKVT